MPDFSGVASIVTNATNSGTLLGVSGLDTAAKLVASTVNSASAGIAGLPGLSNGTTLPNGSPVTPGYQSGFNTSPPTISPTTGDWGPDPSAFYKPTNPGSNLPLDFKTSMSADVPASDQRLQSIRSRSATVLYASQGTDHYTSDRGPITKMKLLKGPGYDPSTVVSGSKPDVTADLSALSSDAGFVNFFMTSLRTDFNEKSQVMMTFGDNEVVYYFGRQPITLNISGILFDSIENDWFAHFLTLYAGVLRGTQLAKSFSLVEITFPNMVVTGSISGLSTSQDSARDTDIAFSMQFIAKEVLPLPAAYSSDTPPSNISGSLIDFNATRTGVAGYSLSSGTIGSGFMDSAVKTVGSLSSDASSLLGGLTGTASGVSNALNSFRTNIFTPVFGVISSITKIVSSVTGTVSSIVSSLTNPVNQVLRDITSIATQASAVALMVESSVNSVISIPARTITNLNNTVASLKSAAGTITRVPEDISESFRRLYGSGRISNSAAILSSGAKKKKSKRAVLSSGIPYTPSKSNSI